MAGDKTTVEDGDVAPVFPNEFVQLATVDAEQAVEQIDPADILRDRDSSMAGVREQIQALAGIHDPERLVQGYEKPFRDALRVEVRAELEQLIVGGGEQLELVRTRYAHRFARLFDMLGLQEIWKFQKPPESDQQPNNPELVSKVGALVEFAQEVNDEFQARMSALVAGFDDCFHQRAEVKDESRMLEKLSKDYGGDLDRLKDVVRCRLVYVGDPRLTGALLEQAVRDSEFPVSIDKSTGIEMVKNGFVKLGELSSLSSLGRYIDIKITVELGRDDRSIPAEVVIATPEMAVATGVEHPFYEIIRDIRGELESEEKQSQMPTDLEDPRQRLLTNLEIISRRFYNLVAQTLFERTKAESSHGRR